MGSKGDRFGAQQKQEPIVLRITFKFREPPNPFWDTVPEG